MPPRANNSPKGRSPGRDVNQQRSPGQDLHTPDIDLVSTCLEDIFAYYAVTNGGESVLTLSRFQRMCLDADLVDQQVTVNVEEKGTLIQAQVDLIYKRTLFRDVTARAADQRDSRLA